MTLITVGDAQIRSALELSLTGRPIAWLGAPKELVEAHRHWLAPHFLEPGDKWRLDLVLKSCRRPATQPDTPCWRCAQAAATRSSAAAASTARCN